MAESEGFEPPDPCGSTVFKTAAFDHSATSPYIRNVSRSDEAGPAMRRDHVPPRVTTEIPPLTHLPSCQVSSALRLRGERLGVEYYMSRPHFILRKGAKVTVL